jgi:hypothetical protein
MQGMGSDASYNPDAGGYGGPDVQEEVNKAMHFLEGSFNYLGQQVQVCIDFYAHN